MSRIGKIARLPAPVREALNKRLHNGEQGPQILPWLNALPETQELLNGFYQGKEINPQNLSDWRTGGYLEWEEKNDRNFQRIEHTRELAQMSMKLAEAGGGSLADGASAIIAGEILGVLEEIEHLKEIVSTDADTPDKVKAKLELTTEALDTLAAATARLRSGDQGKEIIRQNDVRLKQKDEDLRIARAQFEQKLREYEARVAEQRREIEGAVSQARSGGLTPETLERIESAARLL